MIDLEIIQTRYRATTIGPWVSIIEGRDQTSGSSFIMTGIAKGENIVNAKRGEDIYLIGATNADIDFIANARQDIPALVAEVEKLRKLIKNK